MPVSNTDKVLAYWDGAASTFDAIYTGAKPRWARFLDQFLRRDMYERFDWVLRNSGELNGRSVCDLGCGTGRYVITYAQAGARRVLGIDGAPRMVDRASFLIRQAGVQDRAEVRNSNILDYTGDETFDIAIAVGVFDYMRDPRPVLEKIRRIAGSRFLATFPRFWTYRTPIRRIRLGILGCPVYFYTAGQVKALLAGAGFTCQLIERVGAIYCVLGFPDRNAPERTAQRLSP